ncbi:MAG TPA: PIN domain-containing protein [Solirubrobacterales bacterium]
MKTAKPTEVFLIDAGVWVAATTPGEALHYSSNELLRRNWSTIAALDLTFYEIANVVGRKRGQPRDAAQLARAIAKSCRGERLVRVDAEFAVAAIDIAAEHGITAYDAAYVAAARRKGMTLVSTDIRDLVPKGLAVTPDAALYP